MARDLNKYDLMAHEAQAAGQPLTWFERVYAGAISGELEVPWGRRVANPFMTTWLDQNPDLSGEGKTALKIGCGLGDDAEELASRGYQVTAFDIAPSAITLAGQRFPNTQVNYQVADFFNPPSAWTEAFDVIIEIFTIQSLPLALRPQAYAQIASFLKPGGRMFVVCFGRSGTDAQGNSKPIPEPLRMPWPLTREELSLFQAAGLTEISFQEVVDQDNPKVRRFLGDYTK